MKKNSFFKGVAVSLSALLMCTAIPTDFAEISTLVSASEEQKYIALTFDDGPNTTTTNEVLNILEQYNAKASFFLVGDQINDESAEVVKRAFDMGCEIDNHSKSHSYMTNLTAEEISAEVKYVDDYVEKITGSKPSFFRPPYIAVNADMYDAIDVPFICGEGCNDWDDSVTAEQRTEKVLSSAKDGQIILMHDAPGNTNTVEALKTIVPTLQDEGYTLVTLNELFRLQNVVPDEDSMYSIVPYTEGGQESGTDNPGESGITIPELNIPQESIPDTEGNRFVKDMRLGWNLGNTLDAIDDNGYITNELDLETYWNGGYKTTKKMIDAVKAAGFNTVRVPVSWHNHVDSDLNISKAWMDRVQEVVDYAIDNDMYVILNVHHDNSKDTMYPDSEHYASSSRYMTTVWTQIAERFKDYSSKLVFETMNEPRLVGHTYEWWLNMADNDCIDAVKTINRLNQDILDTIRSSGGKNADRFIAVPGYDCSADGATNSYFELPKDTVSDRLIVAVHAYLPYGFALAEVSDSQSTAKFDINSDTAEINRAIDSVYDAYVLKGIPVYIGEFGAREKDGNTQDRVDWAAYFAAYASAHGITCCWWDDISFMLLNRSDATWKQPDIVKALNKYTGGTPNFTPPSDDPVKDENAGKVSYDKVNKSYSISVPKPSDKIYLDVQLSDKAAGGASGCIANGFMKGDTYYWAMVQWKTKVSGEVEIDIDRDFGTLAYSIGDESFTADDPELIAEAKEFLKNQKNFQAQVWWVGDASYEGIDSTNAEITKVYIKENSSGEDNPEEETFITGDISGNGTVDVTDLTILSLYLIGDRELTGAALKAADTDHDGDVKLTDLATLRQYISHIIESLD
ncbi:MAG: cellulase family glycosylhydrolase [Oscillospiraceae bacterium]